MMKIDEAKCREVGNKLQHLHVRPDFYKRGFLSFDEDRETKLRVYLFSVAICHQTHQLVHPGLNLWGWDYLEHGFLNLVKQQNAILNPGYVSTCNELEVEEVLQKTFSPTGRPADCTLDRISQRSRLILDICFILKTNYQSKVSNLLDAAGGKLLENGRGLYEMLTVFPAFADPLRKKSSFFLKLASDAGVLGIRDPENYIPIMDYHMQRVLLRMGCVQVEDDRLLSDLKEKRKLQSDEPVRSACVEAARLLAQVSGHKLLALNDFLWPLGRSCCNETTRCTDDICTKNPCTFSEIVETGSHETCYFEEVCKGRHDENYRSLWEPVVETDYY